MGNKKLKKRNLVGNKKEDLNRIRGMQAVIDPEKGPENKS